MLDWLFMIGQRTELAPEDRVVVNVPSSTALLADVEDHMIRRAGYSIATINMDHVVKLRDLPKFRKAYARQTHVTADGNPIVWLSRLAGDDVSLTPGSELIEPVAALAARHQVPVALFGATEASLRASADALQQRYPELKVVACLAPPMGFDAESDAALALIEDLRTSGARLCFLALGAPKQEEFAARAQQLLPETGFLSIGAGLDFISGSQVRAPAIVRRFAMEWLWRLLSNPRRLAGRYAGCIAILPRLVVMALRNRAKQSSPS